MDVNKPITVAYEDFRQEMASLINSSGLPAFIIETVLKDYLSEVKLVTESQYKKDNAQYQNTLNALSHIEEKFEQD